MAQIQGQVALKKTNGPNTSKAASSGGGGDKGLTLLDQLKGGVTLKSASERPKPEKPAPVGVGGHMAELMKGIQAGKGRLKKVSEDEIEREKKEKKEASTGMFGGAVKAI